LHVFYNEIETHRDGIRKVALREVCFRARKESVTIAGRPTLDVSDDTIGTADELIVIVAMPRQSSKAAAEPLLRAQTYTM
jgi:hypothetical protein